MTKYVTQYTVLQFSDNYGTFLNHISFDYCRMSNTLIFVFCTACEDLWWLDLTFLVSVGFCVEQRLHRKMDSAFGGLTYALLWVWPGDGALCLSAVGDTPGVRPETIVGYTCEVKLARKHINDWWKTIERRVVELSLQSERRREPEVQPLHANIPDTLSFHSTAEGHRVSVVRTGQYWTCV